MQASCAPLAMCCKTRCSTCNESASMPLSLGQTAAWNRLWLACKDLARPISQQLMASSPSGAAVKASPPKVSGLTLLALPTLDRDPVFFVDSRRKLWSIPASRCQSRGSDFYHNQQELGMAQTEAHRIVIVGGGAGGLELATRLGRRLGRNGKASITLVDSSLVHVWKPLYHEVAAGTLDSQEDAVTYLAQAYRSGFQFQYGRMEGLDRECKEILLGPLCGESGREIVPASRLAYDTLVISVGSVSNHFGIPGAAENCMHLDSLAQAENFHRRLVRLILRAQVDPQQLAPLHIAIIGGGATGVELAAELHSAAHRAVHYGVTGIDPERDLRLSLIEAAPRLLPPLSPRLATKAEAQLRKIGVDVLTGERVTAVTAGSI